MNDRFQQMALFVAVAEQGGFSKAARQSGTSVAAVTRAIGALERRVGARLLHRTTRRVELTDAGRRFLVDCRRLLQALEEAENAAAGLHAEPRGTVAVTAPGMFGKLHVGPLLNTFLDRYPQVSVRTLFVDRVVNLLEEAVDVAVRIGELPDSDLRALRVGTVRRCIVASPAYLEQNGTPRRPHELARHACIQFLSLTPHGTWSFSGPAGAFDVPVTARLQTNSGDAAIQAAREGRGLVCLLDYYVAAELQRHELERVLEPFMLPPVPICVLHHEGQQMSGKVRAMVDHLVAGLRGTPAPGVAPH